MTTQTVAASKPAYDEIPVYRAISKAAVVSLVFAVFSLAGLLATSMLFLPLIGIFFGVTALRGIRRYPDELTGGGLARFSIAASLCLFIAGFSIHAYVYATEVPEGYTRINYAMLQPDDDHPEMPVPPIAEQLDGQRVFIKGYPYPDGQQRNIKQFVLVPDMGTCCFGGQPKLTDMIEVTLRDPLRVDFARRQRKLAGTLRVDSRLKPVSGLGGVYYQLDADYVK